MHSGLVLCLNASCYIADFLKMNKQFISVPSPMVAYSGRGNGEITVSLFFQQLLCSTGAFSPKRGPPHAS